MCQPFDPPDGYWPLLSRMDDLLVDSGGSDEWLAQRKRSAAIDPVAMSGPRGSSRQRASVDRMLGQWNVESIGHLATVLGVNWIWFNESERSICMKELPPLIGLALIVSEAIVDLNQTHYDYRPAAANHASLSAAA
jgi:hypothetical protein